MVNSNLDLGNFQPVCDGMFVWLYRKMMDDLNVYEHNVNKYIKYTHFILWIYGPFHSKCEK